MSKNISKVTYYGDVLIDLTNDTVDEQHLLSGTIAHNKYGASIVGTNTFDADTSDANATNNDVLSGKTAYANGSKITGVCNYDSNTSDANATNAQILEGKTAYVKSNKVTGTMQNIGSVTDYINNISSSYNIQQGYHNGSGTVDIDQTEKAKIIPENIKKDIEILGVIGTHEGGGIGQQKTAIPSGSQQIILPDLEYNYLTQVTVEKIPSVETENQNGTTLTIGSV